MKRVYNFSAGPAVLPVPVLQKLQEEMLSYNDSGMSVMEMSHRSTVYSEIIEETERLFRSLMEIPDNYKVLFLQGGASLQFTMVPLNLAESKKIAFIDTGVWSQKAIDEAAKIQGMDITILASSKDKKYQLIPEIGAIPTDIDYLHITTNNTIEGTEYQHIPTQEGVDIVADMSSDILAKRYNVSDFGLIYAGAQKNIGPAGLTIVIIREDLLERTKENIGSMLDYTIMAKNGSMYNTPPTFAIYVAKLVFEWLEELGGVSEMEKINRQKSGMLYDYLDRSAMFSSPVDKESRSLTNIPFITGNDTLDKKFAKEAAAAGFVNLDGHRSVGGMRASLYNAFPLEGVEALVAFMEKFEKENM